MEKCNCYHKDFDRPECWGTRERDLCSCDGDETKCDFYPEKRASAQARKVIDEFKEKIECDIPLGRLCCFKPLDKDVIYFGHMAGKVIDDFENMTFMYVLFVDNRYFFSRKVIIKPDDVHTSNDAKKYFSK